MTGITDSYDVAGRTLLDRDGDKLGKVDEVYTDSQGGQPEWALVQSGLFGTKKTFVPLNGAEPDGEDLRVPIDKSQMKDAPHVDAGDELSEAEERQLFEHYGVAYGPSTTAATGDTSGQTTGHDTSGQTTDDAMTRSEEELRVGTREVERGRVRLRKYVVTEQVTKTVPVSHEEVRIEREPITDQNAGAATDGPEISEEEHEVVLHAEEPVVDKTVVAKERVRLGTETVTGEEEISEEVRSERIETDGADERR
ncbi:PRC and DUF2382 domain-containing protein [Conexibacter sp. CPCC 206217]|uniref:PRC and DUF2382 domain-containing protein n=1 Tax=Conexibacter sp. CPCC 206217 TaxID=3064574 RepID=UPI0027273F00|nr:PRC and DUF2382 domain-containing protein [Conexibacter sp. CPCC 206217]MDO8212184.1 PRC and DUF2382 domain-containing protein [Conexibacter sp. CPCC 206217]